MQDSAMMEGKTMGVCAACGKEMVIRSTRDKKAQYCSRICASRARFLTRYKGTMSGPLDRPVDPMSKSKFVA